jgi:hypothetical protein
VRETRTCLDAPPDSEPGIGTLVRSLLLTVLASYRPHTDAVLPAQLREARIVLASAWLSSSSSSTVPTS